MLTRIIVAVAVTTLCAALGADERPREKSPSFHARTLEGEMLTSQGLRGKTVLVQFWATWCPKCRQDQPAIDTLVREFSGAGLVVIAVNLGERRNKVQDFLRNNPRACKIVLEAETNLARIFRAPAVPSYVVLDAEGYIAAAQLGSGGEPALRRLLAKAGL
ncbi:MAG: TlpA family protein disulfide reductase [Bryobacteraceae bacterium]